MWVGLHAVELGSVGADPGTSSDDGSWGAEILEETIIDLSECSGARSHLGSVGLDPLGLDLTLGSHENGALDSAFEFGDEFPATKNQHVAST